jgi:ABC-type multidrug transport system fused ATPase/permease subunit
MMQGKTVIAIAHRLSTIAWMDWTIVLEKGSGAEIGTYTELLKKIVYTPGFETDNLAAIYIEANA